MCFCHQGQAQSHSLRKRMSKVVHQQKEEYDMQLAKNESELEQTQMFSFELKWSSKSSNRLES